MTEYEAAVVTAYTGVLLGNFSDAHQLIEDALGRPVWTHELASKELWVEIKEKVKPLFMALEVK